MADKLPTLTQGLRDEVIADLQALNIPDLDPACIHKLGAFSQTKAVILVNTDDAVEYQDLASSIRMMTVSIYVATFVPQDRDGELFDLVTSYVEQYARTPMRFGEHAGYGQVRAQQMLGASKRMDAYGEQAWYVCELEMVVPYVNLNLCPFPSLSASSSPSP